MNETYIDPEIMEYFDNYGGWILPEHICPGSDGESYYLFYMEDLFHKYGHDKVREMYEIWFKEKTENQGKSR